MPLATTADTVEDLYPDEPVDGYWTGLATIADDVLYPEHETWEGVEAADDRALGIVTQATGRTPAPLLAA